MRRLFSQILIVGLLGLVGFNAWQISQLKREVANLNRKIVVLQARNRAKSSPPKGTMLLLDKARKHADRVKIFLLKGDFKHAETEYERGLLDMQKASVNIGAPSMAVLEKAQQTLQDTQKSIEHMMQKPEHKGGRP